MRSLRIGLFFCSLISLSIGATPNSQAQYAVNMSLVTCTQYLLCCQIDLVFFLLG